MLRRIATVALTVVAAAALAAPAALAQASGDDYTTKQVEYGDDVYGGTYRLFVRVFEQLGIATTAVDMRRLASVRAAMRKSTRLVWIETPSNPLLKLADLIDNTEDICRKDRHFAPAYLRQKRKIVATMVEAEGDRLTTPAIFREASRTMSLPRGDCRSPPQNAGA